MREAARRGDLLAVRACEGSRVKPLIPDVDLQRARQELLEAREPALTVRAARSEAVLESARRCSKLVMQHLRNELRAGGFDPQHVAPLAPASPEIERLDAIRRSNPLSRD